MEHFYTIQGEGYHTGKAAYFIRTGGCDVKCWWCDVKDSWDAEKHPLIAVGDLVEAARSSGAPFVVITGGEPLMHDLEPLSLALKNAGMSVHIETSGSSPVSGHLDWVTLSPKRFKKPVDEIYACVDELKVVVLTKKDLAWAGQEAAKCRKGTILLLQPEWDTPESMPLIVDYVKNNPGWGISLQTHKFLGVR
ncbi:MAG: radical SAM protein [Balneolaceae bacterium]|nr:MAG: radical SAM protein [Balneolaceae bacterium]